MLIASPNTGIPKLLNVIGNISLITKSNVIIK